MEQVDGNTSRSLQRYKLLRELLEEAAIARRELKELKGEDIEDLPADRFRPLTALNRTGRHFLQFQKKAKQETVYLSGGVPQQQKPVPAAVTPLVLVITDASGGLGCLEPLFRAMEFPCIAYDPLEDFPCWNVTSMEQMAELAAHTVLDGLPPPDRCPDLVVAGVGQGAVLAHALGTKLQNLGVTSALILLEGAGALVDEAAGVDWTPADQRQLLCQVAAQFHDLSTAGGRRAVSKEAIVVRLSILATAAHQLDLLSMLCPREWERRIWAAQVEAAMLRFAVFRRLVNNYTPDVSPPPAQQEATPSQYAGQVTALLQRDHGRGCGTALTRGGPDGCWRQVVPSCQPVALLLLPWTLRREWPRDEVRRIETLVRFAVRLQDEAFRERAHRLVAALEAGGSPRGKGGVARMADLGSEAAHEEGEEEGEGEKRAVIQKAEELRPPTLCIIEPLNALARDMVRMEAEKTVDEETSLEGMASSPRAAHRRFKAPRSSSAGRLAVWMFHTETGQITGAQRAFSKLLDRPTFGLSLGPDALRNARSLEALAAHYCEAILSMQLQGPFLLLATASPVSAALAHSAALRMQDLGRRCGIILADCGIGHHDRALEAEVGEMGPPFYFPNPSTYAIYYFLLDYGTPVGAIAALEAALRGAFTPWEQLLLIDGYRPQTVADDAQASAEWDEILYATLLRSNALKDMLLLQHARRGAPGADPVESMFLGEVALLPPRGREGMLLMAPARFYVQVGRRRVRRVDLPTHHVDSLATAEGREAAAACVNRACRRIQRHMLPGSMNVL